MSDKASGFHTSHLVHRWAFEQLDLPNETPAAEARPRLLKQLADMDFMPPGGWDSALRTSGLTALNADADSPAFVPARRGAEYLLREEVEDFAAKFFSLPPDERDARFEKLAEQCMEMPALTARLAGLRLALDLPCELPSDCGSPLAELLGNARRLFTLRLQECASGRFALLHELREDILNWQEPCARIERDFPRYVELEPDLFAGLAALCDRHDMALSVIATETVDCPGAGLDSLTQCVSSIDQGTFPCQAITVTSTEAPPTCSPPAQRSLFETLAQLQPIITTACLLFFIAVIVAAFVADVIFKSDDRPADRDSESRAYQHRRATPFPIEAP
ncbi:MAG TPA: hypothetical protein VF278_02675 [Pirellulales bacterium]